MERGFSSCNEEEVGLLLSTSFPPLLTAVDRLAVDFGRSEDDGVRWSVLVVLSSRSPPFLGLSWGDMFGLVGLAVVTAAAEETVVGK